MPFRTGFEGYCSSCASVFGETLTGSNEHDVARRRTFEQRTPMIEYGAELFGDERFFTNPSIRSRTWRLKGHRKGRENRFSVFERYWLTEDRLQEVKSIEQRIAIVTGLLARTQDFIKWRREQYKVLTELLHTDGASRETYCMALLKVKTNTVVYQDALAEQASNQSMPPADQDQLQAQLAWLAHFSSTLNEGTIEDATRNELNLVAKGARRQLSGKARELAESKRNLKMERMALLDRKKELENSFPSEAVANCVDAMMQNQSSLLLIELMSDSYGFINSFCSKVVPSIAEGFHAEGYQAERINHFVHEMDDCMDRLSRKRKSPGNLFGCFLEKLVKALIYGPEPKGQGVGTTIEDDYGLEMEEPVGRQIMITQLLTPDGRVVGKSQLFSSDDVVLLGRSDVTEEFVDKCKVMLAEEGEAHVSDTKSLFASKALRVFPISDEHGQVSNIHGAIICEDEVWRYLDFSRFGTRIVGKSKESRIDTFVRNGFRELEPGNVLYLGARKNDGDVIRLHRKAAAIKFSFFLDEDTVVYNSL